MREIKFRSWDKVFKRMDYSSLNSIGFDGTIYYGNAEMTNYKVIIEQYTGMKDKNGKEIYEGDVDNSRFIVTYVDGSDAASLGMPIGFYLQRDNFESWVELSVGDEIEIIGNIHEGEVSG